MKEALTTLLRGLMFINEAGTTTLTLYNLLELHKLYSLYVETIALYYKVDVQRSYRTKRLRSLEVDKIKEYGLVTPYPEYLSDLIDVRDAIEMTIQVQKYDKDSGLNLPMQKILNIINTLSGNEKKL